MTSIEWFFIQLYEKMNMQGDGRIFNKLLRQAEQMHKQEIITAYEQAMETDIYNTPLKTGKQYYNETFKNQQS